MIHSTPLNQLTEHHTRYSSCARCGVSRQVHVGGGRVSTGLCRDCHGSLTVTERKAWA